MNRWVNVTGLCAGLALWGCGSSEDGKPKGREATQEEVVGKVEPLIVTMFDESVKTLDDVIASPAWDSLKELFPSGDSRLVGGLTAGERKFRQFYVENVLADTVDGDRSVGQKVAEFLHDRIFTPANFEGKGIFLVPGSAVCGANDRVTVRGQSKTCAEVVDAIEIRIRALIVGDGLEFTLIIGPNRDEVITLEMHPGEAKLTVYLAPSKGAVEHVAMVLGESVELPRVFEGQVSLLVRVGSTPEVTLEAAVEKAVRIEHMTPSGEEIKFSLAEKQPLIAVHAVGGMNAALHLALDLGAYTVSGPLSKKAYAGGMTTTKSLGVISVDGPGAGVKVEIESGSAVVKAIGVNLGDRTTEVKFNGQRMFAIDLNPNSGRRFDLTLTPTARGNPPELAFAPEVVVAADMRFENLAAALDPADADDIPESLRAQTYRLELTESPTIRPFRRMSSESALLKVVVGQLEFASTAAAQSVVAGTGLCLYGNDAVMDGEHPLLGRFTVGACP